jgi:hypothetical protein
MMAAPSLAAGAVIPSASRIASARVAEKKRTGSRVGDERDRRRTGLDLRNGYRFKKRCWPPKDRPDIKTARHQWPAKRHPGCVLSR